METIKHTAKEASINFVSAGIIMGVLFLAGVVTVTVNEQPPVQTTNNSVETP